MWRTIPAAVIMGKSGVGKTTFYNKLCETDHTAMYSNKSLTRQLYRSEVVHGGNRFTIIDTPGTDSKDEVFKHSFLLKEAMTNEPVNAIFTLIQYNDRCDSALDEFDRTISYLKPEYRDLVVVIIAKFDLAAQQYLGEIQADYKKQFEEEGFPRIMFHYNEMDAIGVAAEMLGFMRSMPKRHMNYEEADFLKYFRVADESRAQKRVVGMLEGEVHEILQRYRDMFQGLGSIEEKDDIIMSAIASSRYEVDQIYEKFTAEFGERMIDLDCYTNCIALQKIIENAHREFRDGAKQLLSYNPDDTSDWKNCIRKCQFCGEVWVKVSGCEGATQCGTRESSKDVSGKPWFQYIFHFDSWGKLIWTRNSLPPVQVSPPCVSMCKSWSTGERVAEQGQSAKGCGKTIVWSDQPRLSKEELAKCLEVDGVENLILSMQKQPEFRQAMKNYVQKIDASFSK